MGLASFSLCKKKDILPTCSGKKTSLKFQLNGPIVELEHSVETLARFLPQKADPSASFMHELTEKPLKSWEGA